MKKSLRKLMAALTALCMCMSLMSMTALATGTTVDTSVGEVPATEESTSNSVTNEDGSTTTNTTTNVNTQQGGVNVSDNTNVQYSETTNSSVTTDSEGNEIASSGKTNGQEIVTNTNTNTVPGESSSSDQGPAVNGDVTVGDAPKLEVTLTPGETGDSDSASKAPEVTAPADQPVTNTAGKEIGSQTSTVTPGQGSTTVQTQVNTSETTTTGPQSSGSEVIASGSTGPVTDENGVTTSTTTETTQTTTTETTTTTTGSTTQTTTVTDRLLNAALGAETETDESAVTETLAVSAADLNAVLKAEGKITEDLDEATAKAIVQAAIDKFENPETVVDASIAGLVDHLVDGMTQSAEAKAAEEIPEIIVEEVKLTIGDKVEDQDEDSTNDKYNATLDFVVVVHNNPVNGLLTVTVLQGGNIVMSEPLETQDGTQNPDGSYTYKCKMELKDEFALTEGLEGEEGYSLNFNLTTQKPEDLGSDSYVYKTTVKVPVEDEGGNDAPSGSVTGGTVTMEDGTFSSGNITASGDKKYEGALYSTENWNGGTYTYTINGVTISISPADETGWAKVTTSADIEMAYIAVKAGSGYKLHAIEGGVLESGTTYLLKGVTKAETEEAKDKDDKGNGKDDKPEDANTLHGVSHVVIIGSGKPVEKEPTPPKYEDKDLQFGFGTGLSQNIDVNLKMGLTFNVDESTTTTNTESSSNTTSSVTTTVETTTTNTWEKTWNNTNTPGGGDNGGGDNGGGGNGGGGNGGGGNGGGGNGGGGNGGGDNGGGDNGGGNRPTVIDIPDDPVPMAPPTDVADEDVEILDEEVPLANIPVTGDASLLWVVLSALSGTGLAGLSFTGKKREEEI